VIDTKDQETECDGYCCYCKLVDRKSDPFPGLRRMFGGSCSGPMISTGSVEEKAEEQLKEFLGRYQNTKWGICGPIVMTVCSERLARCPLYPQEENEFVWVPDIYMGEWIVEGRKLLPSNGSRQSVWQISFLEKQESANVQA
jgi:hypothetical protein